MAVGSWPIRGAREGWGAHLSPLACWRMRSYRGAAGQEARTSKVPARRLEGERQTAGGRVATLPILQGCFLVSAQSRGRSGRHPWGAARCYHLSSAATCWPWSSCRRSSSSSKFSPVAADSAMTLRPRRARSGGRAALA